MHNYGEPNGFMGFISELPLFFKLFGGVLVTFVVVIFLVVIIKGLKTWTSNNNSEVLRRRCKVVDKRTEVWGGSGESSASTNYYITFEFEDNSRKELYVKDNQFGMIVVGDIGELTFQGSRFKEFSRINEQGSSQL
ncbi:hypothetical protein J23TS9_23430 [Paenibacillus sp. J23TS9]|uniref:DUF2500 domain-containing protein n=1 Tax=Paenibacillus sp. J23TS9 TaxID=2807193 RepID=UPI001B00A44C|nr:DUF2500 domain-containing protein [Paenibacillus sp. J23TS9]GIP27213.1 hypothetical protein J23TS9_23430 [Paenibacillus sp. J23TS9]